MQAKKLLYGELAFLIGLTILSIGITLMIISKFGVPPVASLPYILSRIFTMLSFGTCNYLLQICSLILLVVLTRRIKTGYYLSFFIVIGFGYMLDLFEYLFASLPMNLPLQIIYFILGFMFLAFGVSMLIQSRMPILPFDTFVRDISGHFGISLKLVKTSFDMSFVIAALILGIMFVGNIDGIGIGTLVSALLTGKFITVFGHQLDKLFYFKPALKILSNVS